MLDSAKRRPGVSRASRALSHRIDNTMTQQRSLALTLAVLPLLAPHAPAQLFEGTFSDAAVRLLGADQLAARAAPFGRTVAGETTGDRRSDGLVMVGTQPVFLYGPGLYHSLTDFPVVANDVDFVPAATQTTIAMVSARGLEEWWRDDAAGAFVSQPRGTAIWQGAVRIVCADIG